MTIQVSNAEAPSARHAHTATYFSMHGESYIAVLGGSASSANDSNPPFADVFIYNIKQRLWLPVPPAVDSQAGIEQLTPRLFHSATFVEIEHEPYLAIVGGIFSDRTLAVNVPVPTMINRIPSSQPAEDYGQGVYWSWLAGVVQPLGPYYGDAHVVSYGDSLIMFALLDRTASQTHTQPIPIGHRPSRSRTESRSRVPEQSISSYRHDSSPSHSGWALSFSGGSVSFRELRKVRRLGQKAEAAARSIAALAAQAQSQSSPGILEPPVAPALHPQPPTPAPAPASSTIPKSSWLWCGVVNSGWGTATGGEEDLLLLVYQAEGRIFLVPVLLSALGLSQSDSADETSTLGIGLSGLLPALWDGTHRPMSVSYLNPTTPPFADFLLHTSTPEAPPLAVHRSILFSCSAYFKSLLTSGFNESLTGEASVDEGYAAAYAMCCWIYTRALPAWLETPGAFWSDEKCVTPPVEFSYAAHAGETLCELLIAANARMLPALATHVRALIRSEHMYAPELAPLVWRAAELTDVTDTEDLFPCSPSAANAGRWVAEVVQSQMRPTEDRKAFMGAVSKWCCEGDPEVTSMMESARDWLEPDVWDAWVQKRAKVTGQTEGCKLVQRGKGEDDIAMGNT
ncbi:hypothetical protein FRC07_002340 [Ceratobasidium sp. 392]|nr:hypothetical protein FRC07_002340 [Ceratobasidium sp. 392]